MSNLPGLGPVKSNHPDAEGGVGTIVAGGGVAGDGTGGVNEETEPLPPQLGEIEVGKRAER